MGRLQEVTGVAIPANLAGLEQKPERHTTVIPKDKMLDFVVKL